MPYIIQSTMTETYQTMRGFPNFNNETVKYIIMNNMSRIIYIERQYSIISISTQNITISYQFRFIITANQFKCYNVYTNLAIMNHLYTFVSIHNYLTM